MNAKIQLQCRPELLQQWQDDVVKNPQAFAYLVARSPEFLAMLVNDAVAAAWLQAQLAAAHDAPEGDEFARREATITPTILTSQGTYFDFLHPERSEINVEIIAHALSNLCRFTGHCRSFYSVAQHAVLVSQLVPTAFAYQALHHDDAEAFVGDMTSPLKKLLPGYKDIEHRVESEVFQRMGLPAALAPEVKRADLVALRTEQRDLMHIKGGLWTSLHGIEPVANFSIEPLPPHEAMTLYLDRHAELLAAELLRPGVHGAVSARSA